jgi:hypothetical protein
MNETLMQRWSNLQDKLRRLNIVMGVDWDQTPDGRYVTNIFIYKDVKLKSFYYVTPDLEDMIEALEVFYLQAKNKNQSQTFWDGAISSWHVYVNGMVILWSLIFWSIIAFTGYVLFLTPIGIKLMEMAQ